MLITVRKKSKEKILEEILTRNDIERHCRSESYTVWGRP